jgi:REP element-mobilizing transposase RayT
MPRPLRIEFPGALYHLTSRGDGRNDNYLTDDDRALFLSVLGQVFERFNWKCHSYCLMTNDHHLMIESWNYREISYSILSEQVGLLKHKTGSGVAIEIRLASKSLPIGCKSIGYYLVSESAVHQQ